MIKLKFIVLIIGILMTSCYSTKKLINESTNMPVGFSVERINGIYKNKVVDASSWRLWDVLANNKIFEDDWNETSENSRVRIELMNETNLKVSLIENDSVIKSMEFKGRITDGYFSLKKKNLLIPIPAFFIYQERQTIIGNNEKGNLILTHGFKNGGWILVMAAENGSILSYEFERQKD